MSGFDDYRLKDYSAGIPAKLMNLPGSGPVLLKMVNSCISSDGVEITGSTTMTGKNAGFTINLTDSAADCIVKIMDGGELSATVPVVITFRDPAWFNKVKGELTVSDCSGLVVFVSGDRDCDKRVYCIIDADDNTGCGKGCVDYIVETCRQRVTRVTKSEETSKSADAEMDLIVKLSKNNLAIAKLLELSVAKDDDEQKRITATIAAMLK